MKFSVVLLLLLMSVPLFGQNQAVKLHIETAALKMEEGKFDEAAKAYERALNYEPDNLEYLFGYGMALYRQERYQEILDRLEPVIEKDLATIPYYRIIGNCYDLMGNYEKGKEVLKAGIEKYPNEGELQLDLGIIEMIRGDYEQSLKYWEQGIESDPIFSDNYYWCTRLYAKSNEPIWALYYGELFLNLNRNGGDKFDEVSRILYTVYGDMIEKKFDANPELVIVREGTNYLKEAHEQIFSILDKNGLLRIDRGANAEGKINRLRAISMVRKDFLDLWNQVYAEVYPISIYKRHTELLEKNYFESYNFWVMGAGNQEEFWKFHDTRKINYQDYLSWFLNNPMRINIMDYFAKDKYYSTSPQASGPPPAAPAPTPVEEQTNADQSEEKKSSKEKKSGKSKRSGKKKKDSKKSDEKSRRSEAEPDLVPPIEEAIETTSKQRKPKPSEVPVMDDEVKSPQGNEIAVNTVDEPSEPKISAPEIEVEKVDAVSEDVAAETGLAEEPEVEVLGTTETASDLPPALLNPYQAYEVDSLPEYPGGDYALREYLHREVQVPENCYHKTDQITLYVSVVLNEEGSVHDAKLKKGDACGMEDRLLEVIKDMPAWMPGYRKGDKVPVVLTLPVKFRLE